MTEGTPAYHLLSGFEKKSQSQQVEDMWLMCSRPANAMGKTKLYFLSQGGTLKYKTEVLALYFVILFWSLAHFHRHPWEKKGAIIFHRGYMLFNKSLSKYIHHNIIVHQRFFSLKSAKYVFFLYLLNDFPLKGTLNTFWPLAEKCF